MDLKAGQVAVVTGGASGIGLAIAGELLRRGLQVVIGDNDPARLNAAVGEFAPGAAPLTRVCGVSHLEAVFGLRDFALIELGRVDLVFNNAGVVLPFAPMWEHEKGAWDWPMQINLGGAINGIQAFVPHFVRQGRGHVVNTASMAGVSVVPRNGAYNAAKHAVVSLTETLAAEFAELAPGLRASVICLGLVPTRIHESAPPGGPATTSKNQPKPVVDVERHTVSAELAAQRALKAWSRTGSTSSPTRSPSGSGAVSPRSSATWLMPRPLEARGAPRGGSQFDNGNYQGRAQWCDALAAQSARPARLKTSSTTQSRVSMQE